MHLSLRSKRNLVTVITCFALILFIFYTLNLLAFSDNNNMESITAATTTIAGRTKNNTVYTFYEDIGFGTLPLLEYWKQSWMANGWVPVVLNSNVARKHPNFQYLYDRFEQMPTVNLKTYEMNCFIRWIAMVVVGGGYISDYDTLNIDFAPPPFTPDNFTIYQGIVPALVSGSAEEYQRVLNELAQFKLDPSVHHINGKPHTSDMHIFEALEKRKLVNSTFHLIKSNQIVHLSVEQISIYREKHKIDHLDKVEMARRIVGMSKEEAKRLVETF